MDKHDKKIQAEKLIEQLKQQNVSGKDMQLIFSTAYSIMRIANKPEAKNEPQPAANENI